jgi:probable HAF family extracellular repeat protein
VSSRGFLLRGGAFTPIAFPLASGTTAFGINDAGEIAGIYTDAGSNPHGFIFANGAFSTIDVAGASGTQLTRIRNSGLITGVYIDALDEQHGLVGQ